MLLFVLLYLKGKVTKKYENNLIAMISKKKLNIVTPYTIFEEVAFGNIKIYARRYDTGGDRRNSHLIILEELGVGFWAEISASIESPMLLCGNLVY